MTRLNYDRLLHPGQYQERFNLVLKPCPFCNSKNVALYLGPLPHITCTSCNADGPLIEVLGDGRDAAQYRAGFKWNERRVAE